MMKNLWFIIALPLVMFSAGCSVEMLLRSNFDAACESSLERRQLSKTGTFLESLADRYVGRARQLARLESARKEDFSSYTAENDPRFMWALEVECWARMIMLSAADHEEPMDIRVAPVVRNLLEFEQAVWWAKFDTCKSDISDPRREQALLVLVLTTGWSERRINRFDFSSLPMPAVEAVPAKSAKPASSDGIVSAASEVLLLASQVPVPAKEVIMAEISHLRDERIALAATYLDAAEKRWRSNPDAAALEAWRIARARFDFERSCIKF